MGRESLMWQTLGKTEINLKALAISYCIDYTVVTQTTTYDDNASNEW